MATAHSISTDAFDTSKFKPHGRVEYEERGNVLLGTAFGPFNMELLGALQVMAGEKFPKMATKGRWVHIATFRNSALCAPEVLEGLKDAMLQLVQLGVAPELTAFVLPPDVEGHSLMGPLYAKAIQASGARFRYFHTLDEANAWVSSTAGPLAT